MTPNFASGRSFLKLAHLLKENIIDKLNLIYAFKISFSQAGSLTWKAEAVICQVSLEARPGQHLYQFPAPWPNEITSRLQPSLSGQFYK